MESEASGEAIVEEIEMTVFEFDDLAAINTDEVVVGGAVVEVRVIGCLAITEVDFLNEIGFIEKREGAIDGGA